VLGVGRDLVGREAPRVVLLLATAASTAAAAHDQQDQGGADADRAVEHRSMREIVQLHFASG
jgi:hypothetical protein